MTKPKAIVSWSSGKDSAWALHRIRQENTYEIAGLLTTVNESAARVAMHGVRETLLDAQAARTGLPLIRIPLPWPCTNDIYETRMAAAVDHMVADGVSHVIFGDLFLEDIRAYREKQLGATPLAPVFPLWKLDTRDLVHDMLAAGVSATVVCVDPKQLDRNFAGRPIDEPFLRDLPESVDPCGENGEFHTLVTDGPMFSAPISTRLGDIVERDGFVYADMTVA